jgi:hypothetical protein
VITYGIRYGGKVLRADSLDKARLQAGVALRFYGAGTVEVCIGDEDGKPYPIEVHTADERGQVQVTQPGDKSPDPPAPTYLDLVHERLQGMKR